MKIFELIMNYCFSLAAQNQQRSNYFRWTDTLFYMIQKWGLPFCMFDDKQP